MGGLYSLSLDEYVIRKVSKISYYPKFPFYHEIEGLTFRLMLLKLMET